MENLLQIKPEVSKALEKGQAVVALESTIIAHGMPYPDNIETALDIERIIRDKGAIPATIGIIDGKIKVGMTEEEIKFLGQSDQVTKVSRRDMPAVLAQKLHGATTVAGTMIAASLAGIEIFVTGGIGGVHRGADKSFDISADLQELKQTGVTVVSAGIKSILDIKSTLERLETFGVPVLGYKTSEFPAFYSRKSGYEVDYKLNSAREAAKTIEVKRNLGLSGGILIANPVPEGDSINFEVMNNYIEKALREAETKEIIGKEITPYLLDKIKGITDGRSLRTNISLVKDNAKVGAEIAVKLAER